MRRCQLARPGEREALQIEKTTTAFERMRGLLGRTPLRSNQAIWIAPCNGVHSLFMPYAIDVVYLNSEMEIVKRVEKMAPWRFSMCLKASSVVELAAGGATEWNLEQGDVVNVQAL